MQISREDLEQATAQLGLAPEQGHALWEALERRAAGREERAQGTPPTPDLADLGAQRATLAHLLYFSGALIVMGALGWFVNLAWESFGGLGLAAIAAAYAVTFVLVGRELWFRRELLIPGGLMHVLAVWMVPLLVYGLEAWLGWWPSSSAPGRFSDFHPYIRGGWVLMELCTIAAGLLALRTVRFPFLTFPITYMMWFLSMDLPALLTGDAHSAGTFDEYRWSSLVLGALLVAAAVVTQRRSHHDFALWGYLFGFLMFWGGLSSLLLPLPGSQSSITLGLALLIAAFVMDRRTRVDFASLHYLLGMLVLWSGLSQALFWSAGELLRLAFVSLQVLFVLLSLVLERKVFVVLGGIGVTMYLGHLAGEVFRDSVLFPFALSGLGLGVIALGVLTQKHYARLQASVLGAIPSSLQAWLPANRPPL